LKIDHNISCFHTEKSTIYSGVKIIFCILGQPPSSAASIWSAVAATCSAVAAITIVRIQRNNMLDSAQPELILTEWSRKNSGHGDQKFELLTFKKIRNVGKGSALHLYLNSSKVIDNKPLAISSTERLSILPPNGEYEINGEIALFWNNAAFSVEGGPKYIPIDVKIYSWCSKNYRYETLYKLMAFEPSDKKIVDDSNEIAPGIILTARTTVRNPVWKLKMFRQLSRLPIVGKRLSNPD